MSEVPDYVPEPFLDGSSSEPEEGDDLQPAVDAVARALYVDLEGEDAEPWEELADEERAFCRDTAVLAVLALKEIGWLAPPVPESSRLSEADLEGFE